ncbi:MAG: hypothetical protein RJA44_1911, partial [Pseudomonadota bacterium]
AEPASPDPERLAWVWLGLITLFFSLPASKLVGYILPVVPAAALLIGSYMGRCDSAGARWPQRTGLALSLAGLLLCLGATGLIARFDQRGHAPLARQLQPLMQAGDQLVFWDDEYYDLPLLLSYWRPVPILGPALRLGSFTGDGWQQELLDAAEFDLPLGRQLLLQPEGWAQVRCAAPRSWLIGEQSERERIAAQTGGLAPQFSVGRLDVYLATARECPVAAQQEGR